MTNYKVQRLDGRVYEKCEKHILKLWNMDDRKEITTQRLSFSEWQLQELNKYKSRVKDWADKNIRSDVNRSNIEVDVDEPTIRETS